MLGAAVTIVVPARNGPRVYRGEIGMNKADLIEKIAKEGKCSKVAASKMIDSLTSNVTKSLKKGERVTLVGFGTFSISKRKARIGRNPQTGEPIKISARKVVRFKAGKELEKKVR